MITNNQEIERTKNVSNFWTLIMICYVCTSFDWILATLMRVLWTTTTNKIIIKNSKLQKQIKHRVDSENISVLVMNDWFSRMMVNDGKNSYLDLVGLVRWISQRRSCVVFEIFTFASYVPFVTVPFKDLAIFSGPCYTFCIFVWSYVTNII